MRFDREPWVKLYKRESPAHRLMSLEARCFRDFLLRHTDDKGLLLERSNNVPRDLCLIIAADSMNAKKVDKWLKELQDVGYAEISQEGRVVIPKFEEAQTARSPGAKRQAEYEAREKAKRAAQDSDVRTDAESDVSPDVIREEMRRDEMRRDPPNPPRGLESQPAVEPPTTLPGNLERALKVPVSLRCKLALERKDLADHACAQQWPEILEASSILAPAMGIKSPRFDVFSKDSNVRALASLLAAGFSFDELRHAAAKIPGHSWLSDKRKFSALTVPMLNELLAADAPKPPQTSTPSGGPAPVSAAASAAKEAADRAFIERRRRELGLTTENAVEGQP